MSYFVQLEVTVEMTPRPPLLPWRLHALSGPSEQLECCTDAKNVVSLSFMLYSILTDLGCCSRTVAVVKAAANPRVLAI